MEITIVILTALVIVPVLFASWIAIWLINMLFALVVNGPREGIQEIKTWFVRN